MKTRYILLLLFFGIALQAQDLPKIVPPTPEAASLMKFVETPVSHYNGTPNINIPIYTINAGGVSLPVGLSYNAKGIQVAEMASRVGIGWTLNAGGMISRQMRGFPDEYGYLKKNFTQYLGTNDYITTGVGSSYYNLDITRPGFMSALVQGSEDPLNPDLQPDVFMFNFAGMSGKFIFDHVTKQPVLQTKDDIVITFTAVSGNPYQVDQFVITDKQGNKYYFGKSKDGSRTAKEQKNSISSDKFSTGSDGWSNVDEDIYASVVNGWYLMEIETPDKSSIKFFYGSETVTYYTREKDQLELGNNACYFSKHIDYQNQLSKIEFDQGYLSFVADSGLRQDLSGGHTLKEIILYDTANVQKKKFAFAYSYTTAPNDSNQLGALKTVDGSFSMKRLFLTSITEKNSDNTKNLPYTFEYSSVVLPCKHSNMVDNWGYYNGKPNGEFLAFFAADRRVDVAKAEAGLLKKITYPTGGFTQFEYEHNVVRPPSFYSELLMSPSNPTTNKSAGLLKSGTFYSGGTLMGSDYYGGSYKTPASTPIVIQNYPRNLRFNVSFDTTGCPAGADNPGCRYEVYFKNADTGTLVYKLLQGESIPGNFWPGSYIIEVVPKGPHHPYTFIEAEEFSVFVQWTEEIIPSDIELYAAGKRIKKITNKKDATATATSKEYLYLSDDGKSSGKLFSIPNYFYIHKRLANGGLATNGLSSNGSAPVANYQGGQLGYTKVTEIALGDNNNGKTEYSFTSFSDTGDYYRFPYHIPTDMEWLRGMPIKIKHYRYAGGSYQLVKSTENEYAILDYPTSPVPDPYFLAEPDPPAGLHYYTSFRWTRIPILTMGHYVNLIEEPWTYDIKDFRVAYFLSGRADLTKTKETDYFYNDSNVLTGQILKTSTFNYSSTVHHQLTSQTVTGANGTIIETKFFYPQDASMAGEPQRSTLVSANRFEILKTENWRDGLKLSEQKTEFKDWGNGLIAPELVKAAKNTATAETRVRYTVMDNTNGNPLEVQKENGTKISYIWGYNKTQPVAMIENIAYTSIPSGLVTDIQSTTDEPLLLGKLTELRNHSALAGAMVTTYTYIPLVGVSTITDPKGDKITYVYDKFGRLEKVLDKGGKILSENEYHYANEY